MLSVEIVYRVTNCCKVLVFADAAGPPPSAGLLGVMFPPALGLLIFLRLEQRVLREGARGKEL